MNRLVFVRFNERKRGIGKAFCAKGFVALLFLQIVQAAAAFSGSPDQKLLLQFGFPKDKIPFDQSVPRQLQMRSPLAYATSFKVSTRIYYGSEERVFDLTSKRTAELAKAAKLDVETVVTVGNHESRVSASIKRNIEFFNGQMNAKTLAVLKARSVADEQPCVAGKHDISAGRVLKIHQQSHWREISMDGIPRGSFSLKKIAAGCAASISHRASIFINL